METAPNPLDGICAHLEFLGFKITRRENGARADAEQGPPRIVIIAEKPLWFLFTASYTAADGAQSNRLGYLEWVNLMNQKSALITAFAENDGTLTFAGVFPKIYDKQLFGGFFQAFCNDIRNSLYGPEAKTEAFLA